MNNTNSGDSPNPKQNKLKRHSIFYYLSMFLISILVIVFLLFGFAGAFLLSPMGNKITTNYINNTFNKSNTEIKLNISSFNLTWSGLKAFNVKIMDNEGEFLSFSTLILDIDIKTLMPSKSWNFNIYVNNLEVNDLFIKYIPQVLVGNEDNDTIEISQSPLIFLPNWLKLEFNNIKINNASFNLYALDSDIFSEDYNHLFNANLKAKLKLSHDKADFQAKLSAKPLSKDSNKANSTIVNNDAPNLMADNDEKNISTNRVTSNTIDSNNTHNLAKNGNTDSIIHNQANNLAQNNNTKSIIVGNKVNNLINSGKVELNISGTFNNNNLNMNIKGSDLYILQNFWLNNLSITDKIPYKMTLNAKLNIHIPSIIPQKEYPLSFNINGDFDLHNIDKKSYLANMASANANADFTKLAKITKIKVNSDFSYDNEQFFWENFKINIPAQNPNIFIESTGSYQEIDDNSANPAKIGNLAIKSVNTSVSSATITTKSPNSTDPAKIDTNSAAYFGIGSISAKTIININNIDKFIELFWINTYKIKGNLKSTLHLSSQDINLSLILNSPTISTLNGDIKDIGLNLSISTNKLLEHAQSTIPKTVHGLLNLEAKSFFAMGQAKISSDITIDNFSTIIKNYQTNAYSATNANMQQQTVFEQLNYLFKNTNLNIKKLSAELPGIKINAKIHKNGQSIKQGFLDINIKDMKVIEQLTNLPIKGSPLMLNIKTLASSTLANPIFNSNFKLGAGSYADFYWESAEGEIVSTLNESNFELKINSSILALARGKYNYYKKILSLDYLSVHEKTYDIKVILDEPYTTQFGNKIIINGLQLTVAPFGKIDIKAQYSQKDFNVNAHIKDVSLLLLKPFLGNSIPKGIAEANIQINGTPSLPNGSFQVHIKDIDFENNLPKMDLIIDGELQNKKINNSIVPYIAVNTKLSGFSSLENFKATAEIPLLFLIKDYEQKILPISTDISWNGNIGPLYAFVPHDTSNLTGFASFNAQISGSIKDPLIKAQVYLVDTNFTDSVRGIHFNNITLEALYDSNKRSLIKFSATDNQQGTIIFNGEIPRNILLNEQIDIKGQIRNFKPITRDDFSIQLSGDINIHGLTMEPLIEGNIYIDNAQLQLLQTHMYTNTTTIDVNDKKPKPTIKRIKRKKNKKPAYNPMLALNLIAPNNLFVRGGTFLDSEWASNINITGELINPIITGSISPVKGKLILIDKEFNFTDGAIFFNGSIPVTPQLDLNLEAKSSVIDAIITINGTATSPRLTISSQPALPKDEIISYLLFNKKFSELSHFELIQVASATSELLSIGRPNLDILTNIRKTMGFEVLKFNSRKNNDDNSTVPTDASVQSTDFNSDVESNPSIEAGKYILDNVYLGVGQDLDDNFSTEIIIKIEVMPSITLDGKTSDTSSEIGISWKMDY